MDYSKLTNPELDKLIAEERGWRKIDFGRGEIVWRYMNDFPMYKDDEAPVHFATDPRYAMELLKEMPNPQITKDVDFWRVVPDVDVDMEHYIICDDINLERAIAEAWLQWSENEPL